MQEVSIVLILGGARSGKSTFAEKMALRLRGNSSQHSIAYIATAESLDEEFRIRIQKHQSRRGPEFSTIEEPIDIGSKITGLLEDHQVILLECLTTWLGNLFFHLNQEEIEPKVESELRKINSLVMTDQKRTDFKEILKELDLNQINRSVERLFEPNRKVLIVVSNEIGLGIVPADAVSRQYRDIHGRMNQQMAAMADCVYFIHAAIPQRVK
jgi:adenosylcobinamide kinase/adenosylcobinamide-phosphate guanylyltransferase